MSENEHHISRIQLRWAITGWCFYGIFDDIIATSNFILGRTNCKYRHTTDKTCDKPDGLSPVEDRSFILVSTDFLFLRLGCFPFK